jgi:broad specificity phosphatase PhoE
MTDYVGNKLAGRVSGIHLNAIGLEQARGLAGTLERVEFQAIFSSPLERTLETARPLAERRGLEIRVREELNEVDFGDWNNKSFDELAGCEWWRNWNDFRSGARIPGGERMIEIQVRIVKQLEMIQREFADGTVAVVSHGDVIRGALAYFLGIPLDLVGRFEVNPGSYSILELDGKCARVLCLNREFAGAQS